MHHLSGEKMYYKVVKLFLRFSIGAGFLSAVADRFGMWSAYNSAWGNWANFLKYTAAINPWIFPSLVSFVAVTATAAEIFFGICLIIGYRTEMFAKLSGILLLLFALAMTSTVGIKKVFDASVFAASAASFALSLLKEKYMELDSFFINQKRTSNRT
ncbi:MAG: DoxX protein [Chitinophagaceae bacterium]|nr:DoxX protein [Chitinophagaceae bacterium]